MSATVQCTLVNGLNFWELWSFLYFDSCVCVTEATGTITSFDCSVANVTELRQIWATIFHQIRRRHGASWLFDYCAL